LDTLIKPTGINENKLIWAIICSFLLHILLVAVIPQFKFEPFKKVPDVLKVELVQAKKPEPVEVIKPKIEPPKPIEPTKPKAEPIKPPPKTTPKPEPVPAKENKPEVAQSVPPPTPPAVIAVTPKTDVAPAIIVPTPEPVKDTEPSASEINAALKSYKSILKKEFAKQTKYSPMALKHGLQGTVYIISEIDPTGKILNTYLCKSSGYDLLDNSALKSIKSLSSLPLPKYMQVFKIRDEDDDQVACSAEIIIPEGHFRIKTPVIFKLDN
jgi:periplasmic protein TonB